GAYPDRTLTGWPDAASKAHHRLILERHHHRPRFRVRDERRSSKRAFLCETCAGRTISIMTNITLIGAGSVEFTRILLADLAEFPELAGSAITLHDIHPERLDTAERISQYTIETTGAKLQLRAEIDRRAALDGADFV